MSTYNFKDIEPKWQKEWADKKSFAAPVPTAAKPAYYILVMFPYPSGNLHMGHVRNYTIGDVLARFHRRRNRSVLHPIGWDSFGLPAENAAIKNKTDPASWTWKNIAVMRDQLKTLAISYDWDREIATCHPDYYRWNQWLFIKMLEKGLAYRKNAPVNWCNSCMTVLANEQVHNGHCWRCDSLVVQKDLTQWFYKITAYADELLTGHDQLQKTAKQKGWPEQVLAMQKNWIGKSWGAYADFSTGADTIRVFTTRPDTLAGATFLVLAPEHPLVQKLTTSDQRTAVDAYRTQAKGLSKIMRTAENREKTGVFSGSYAENPLTGAKVPVWIADYVLTDYGTGAIMAVPAHDQRDFDFAKQFKLPIIQVVQGPADSSPRHASGRGPGVPSEEPARRGERPKDRRDDEHMDHGDDKTLERAYEAEGILINSGVYNGLSVEDAQKKMSADLEAKKKGGPTVTFKLRDWLLSRQRYWGTPIPIVYCKDCGAVPVKLSDLPIVLPTNVTFTGEGASPLTQAEDWINTTCPTCGKPARRETDTMDTFVDSSWYYARYTDPKNTSIPFDADKANTWIPVHQYVGGNEHANMHLIYSRFIHKVFRDMDMIKSDEPFSSLLTQGMVTLGGSAMSKSKGNVVDPNDVIERYGADTCRLFILFAAPPTQQLEWSDKQIEGIWRFLNRVWRAAQAFIDPEEAKALKRTGGDAVETISADELTRREHVTIQRVTRDIDEDFGFNTAISALMELTNAIYLYPNIGDAVSRSAVETVIQLLAPFAPHMTEELWWQLGHKELLSERPWPVVDTAKLAQARIEMVVQVNGKVKERISVASSANEALVTSEALAALKKKGVAVSAKRVIYVPQKLVNFVG